MDVRSDLLGRVRALTLVHDQTIIGIAGPPAAGKSTLAQALVAELIREGIVAAYLPMDGFHLSNVQLDRQGLTDRKGAPETFDVGGYLDLLYRLRRPHARVIYAPDYSRILQEPIGACISIPPDASVIITEGNYLLLPHAPWSDARASLDEVWYLEAPVEVRRERLIERQERGGKNRASAEAWADGSDARNAMLVSGFQDGADLVVSL